jgi:hypothetical protein
MQFTVDIPDSQVSRVADAFATVFRWPTGMTAAQKRAAFKAQLITYIRLTVKQAEGIAASHTATQTSDAAVDAIPIT